MIPQDRLLEIFANRPNRFALIEQGMRVLDVPPGQRWIEIGCNTGEVTAYINDKYQLDALGVDCDEHSIAIGKAKHPEAKLIFATAQNIPVKDVSIDGIISEAAWSPLTDKGGALQEYVRVMKRGGHIIINDFILKPTMDSTSCTEYRHIPCFAGVDTLDEYVKRFCDAGFECIQATTETNALLSLTFHIMKECNVKADEIGPLLSSWGNDGKNSCGHDKDNVPRRKENDVIANAGLGFGQLLLRKR